MNIVSQFLLGRYYPGKSFIHKIDPRVKIALTLIVSVTLFLINDAIDYFYLILMLLFAIIFSKINLKRMLKGMVPILWIIMIGFLMHLLMPPRNVFNALEISLRLLILFSWATVLTLTTQNTELAKAISWYAKPLKIIGVSGENIALTFSLSLRFFPIILEEAESIIKANKMIEKIPFTRRLESFCTTFIFRVLKKSENISYALINRDMNMMSLYKIAAFEKVKLSDLTILLLVFTSMVLMLS